ncbi:cupin domain-containing protein [Emticicia sp. BO119]|uniref:cupin domain-containing protein n=1 Tax=Emticicia sp. BO119 TaxID=2757768 RepID=UPI0015EFE009|nr:cupin domain-containing protein [Emticicia sp. BO119]MBA4853014.1 cupin domain-containing protein [Emticicia sp. BO119]
MEDVKNILESGIIDEFCLGLLPKEGINKVNDWAKEYPEIEQKIQETFTALGKYSFAKPSDVVKKKTFDFIRELSKEQQLSLEDKPKLSKYSDLNAWNELLKDHQPDQEFGIMKIKFLIDQPTHQLCLAWLEDELSETEHHEEEFHESFFILEGSCICNVGGKIIHLQAGDYLDIPENTIHTIKNTSINLPYVKALIQRLAA